MTEEVARALKAGAEALFVRQRTDGLFTGDAQRSSPANTAAVIVALHQVDPKTYGELITAGADWLVATQRPDGGWASHDVPTEILTTAVAAAALRVVAPHRREQAERADTCVAALGGVTALTEPAMIAVAERFATLADPRVPTTSPRFPLELLLFRRLSARILGLRLPVFAASALAQAATRSPRRRLDSMLAPLALRLVRRVFEFDGANGQFCTDPWLTSLICIGLVRAGTGLEIARSAADWLSGQVRADGCWDTMPLELTWSQFAASGLVAGGWQDDPRLSRVWDALRRKQSTRPFDVLSCPPGYWGFCEPSDWPMALETAEISSLLATLPGGADDPHVRIGIQWLARMQDSGGSWSIAVRNARPGGFGPCPYVTAQAVTALLDSGVRPADTRVRKALRWLAKQQHEDGSFETLWYRGGVPSTSVVLEVFARADAMRTSTARRARDWLVGTQLDDGSWGSVEETAWALRALLATSSAPEVVASKAVDYLLGAQQPDGDWPGGPINEYVRGCLRYADGTIATGLAMRALGRVR